MRILLLTILLFSTMLATAQSDTSLQFISDTNTQLHTTPNEVQVVFPDFEGEFDHPPDSIVPSNFTAFSINDSLINLTSTLYGPEVITKIRNKNGYKIIKGYRREVSGYTTMTDQVGYIYGGKKVRFKRMERLPRRWNGPKL